MNFLDERWGGAIATVIRDAWIRHAGTLMRLAIVLLAVLAALKLGDEFQRLIWDEESGGAWDLKLFHHFAGDWFAGRYIYAAPDANYYFTPYPPASFVLFYLLLGWMPVSAARWFWAATTIAVLVWLVYLLAKHSGAETRVERTLVALFLLSMNATGGTVGIGQLSLHVLPFLMVGLLALRQPVSWRRDLVAALCMIVTLIKPNISVPFLWLVLFSPGGWRVLSLITLGYGALTLFAASFQSTPLLILMHDWLALGSLFTIGEGYGNVSKWFADLGLGEWALLASLLSLTALGIWTYWHRRADLWMLLGVVAIAARLWIRHTLTSDVLILLPLLALFRIAKRGESAKGVDVTAGILLAATMLMMLLPARIEFMPSPWNFPYTLGKPLIWTIVLVFLMVQTDRAMKNRVELESFEALRTSTA